MPDTLKADIAKGSIPKAHREPVTLADLYRDETVYHAKASKVLYKERGL